MLLGRIVKVKVQIYISAAGNEDRFEVVQWLAAILTFSSQRELRLSDLESLIPSEVRQFLGHTEDANVR